MIVPIEQLSGKLCDWHDEQIVVLAHGCFDLLHVGHIRHLEAARRLGTILVVTITPDQFVLKGDGRPLFNESVRAECVAALRCVDYVAINDTDTAPIKKYVLPAIYVKGAEYRDRLTPALERERAEVESIGGRLVFTSEDTCHTTEIVNEGVAESLRPRLLRD